MESKQGSLTGGKEEEEGAGTTVKQIMEWISYLSVPDMFM